MGSPFTVTSVSNYNSNPPSDDGAETSTNRVQWSTQKTKLADPVYNAFNTSETATSAAFGKVVGGAGITSTAISYTVTAADQSKLIKVTASGITITTPDATSVGAPFVFSVSNQSSGTITLAGNGVQTVDGQATQTIAPGGGCTVNTDGTNWFTFGLKAAQFTAGSNPPFGFDVPINLQLNASVASNILTIAVKANNGSDPTASNPVLIPFRDSTIANGDPVWLSITSALSITTNATGATLGSQNGVPFRFWIVAFNNSGTVVLALWHSGAGASTAAINPLNEWMLQNTTGISAAATSSGVFYTPNGTSLSSCAFRIIGFLEYSSGLTTAGTYASVPTTLQLFGPGIKKPGDLVQKVYNTTGVIVPSSKISLINVSASISWNPQTTNNTNCNLKRGATTVATVTAAAALNTGDVTATFANILDNPATTSSTTYSATFTSGSVVGSSLYCMDELMG